MIKLDFIPDEATLTEDGECDPHIADPAALEQTYFEMPLRFTVDGEEVLNRPLPWRALPLLGFATLLTGCVRQMHAHGHAQLSLAGGGALAFTARGEVIEVRHSPGGWTVTMLLSELEPAVASFLDRVRVFLLARFPLLVTHAHWSDWFGPAVLRA